MIDTALTTLLKAHAGVGDRVHSGAQLVKVTTDLPKLLYSLLGIERRYTDDGNTGLTQGRYQIDIFAVLPSDARAIADAIRLALDGYQGTQDDTRIERLLFRNERQPR